MNPLKLIFLVFLSMAFLAARPQEANLVYKLKPGLAWTMESNMHTTMVQKVMGIDQEIMMDMLIQLEAEVISRHNNVYTISYTYDRLRISTKSAMFVVEMDTEGAPGPDNQMMSVLIGKPFTVEMDQQGRILSVTGLGKIIDATDSIPGIDSLRREQFRNSLKESFGEEAFRRSLEQSMVYYPAYPVKTGETWSYDFTTSSSNITLIMHNLATLITAGRNSYLVRINSTIQTPLNDTVNMGGNKGAISMTGRQIAEVQIASSPGLPVESNTSQDISGKLILFDVPGSDENIEVPMTMTTKVTTTVSLK